MKKITTYHTLSKLLRKVLLEEKKNGLRVTHFAKANNLTESTLSKFLNEYTHESDKGSDDHERSFERFVIQLADAVGLDVEYSHRETYYLTEDDINLKHIKHNVWEGVPKKKSKKELIVVS